MTQLGSADPYYALDRFSLWGSDKIEIDKKTEILNWQKKTEIENHRKKSHSTLRAKRAMFTFWVDKNSLKMPKMVDFWRVFEKFKACGQTVLPDRTILIGQKMVENVKIENSNETF